MLLINNIFLLLSETRKTIKCTKKKMSILNEIILLYTDECRDINSSRNDR